VSRGALLYTLAILAIAVVALACLGPTEDVAPGSPAAQATDVRRTAIAEVQRIIANKPTPTPLPAATPRPAPSCPNAIWWTEARSHLGESRTVEGTIVAARITEAGLALLQMGEPYPDPTGLVLQLPASAPSTALGGKSVCASGRIALAEGRPVLQVSDPGSIQVIGQAD
jgi:hypothetical protein